jgi:leucyl aminopeptidase
MRISIEALPLANVKTELLAIPVFSSGDKQAKLPKAIAALDQTLGKQLTKAMATGDFSAKNGTTLTLYPNADIGAKRILLVGMNQADDFKPHTLRRAAGSAAKVAQRVNTKKFAFYLPSIKKISASERAQVAVEGAVLGAYRFEEFQSKASKKTTELTGMSLLLEASDAAAQVRAGAKRGATIASSQNLARDLSNQPGNALPPAELARRARAVAREVGLRCQIYDEKALAQMKMGGILAVGQGSINPPRLVILEHKPKGTKARSQPVCIVGKGITFDSGGISLKPGAGMHHMKHDMSGAATVVGTLRACALLNLPVHVVGLVSTAENLPDAKAYRPGDVITSLSGKTIEVLNTDAEGRIVLADALTHAAKTFKPEAMIDLATLTGASLVALGKTITAMLGSDRELMKRISTAGENVAEPVWQLPLRPEHTALIKSKVADIKNTGGRDAGTITAAAFLAEFTHGVPWSHLDIAGTADTLKPNSTEALGATGVGVRLLIDMLQSWKALK